MCGILGHLAINCTISKNMFLESLEFITHRGPDDFGIEFHICDLFEFYQGFKRLSIIDLSIAGHQPMSFDNLTITFNGEVYNYIEIREELLTLNYSFDSNTDTEVILKAYHYWGNRAFEKFNGMFAISIYDSLSQKIILVRDRVGIKPLYWYWDNNSFVYSSEIKPILNFDNIDKSFNTNKINSFLSNGYVPSPYTVFNRIFSLEPGHILEFTHGEIKIDKYWSLIDKFNNSKITSDSEEKIKIKLDELISSSVKYRMISDVPIGAFLSGGIDSSLVSAIMQKESNSAINTFSIGFKETKYDEAPFARTISKHIGSNHNELYLSMEETKELVPEMIQNFDMPFGDSSSIPMMLVSKLAKEKVTVSLSGDGGDELFCGYKLYDQALRFSKFVAMAKLIKPLRLSIINSKIGKQNYKYLNLLYTDTQQGIINSGSFVSQIYLEGLVKNSEAKVDEILIDNSNKSSNIQEANMLLNMKTYLPDDILKKVDISSMAVSLEARVPLLDTRIIEYSFSIPHHLKYYKGEKKYILKELLYDYIPKELVDRPKKGFSVPISHWLHNDMYYLVSQASDKQFILNQGIFELKVINELVLLFKIQPNNYYLNSIVWNFVVFQLWYKENIL